MLTLRWFISKQWRASESSSSTSTTSLTSTTVSTPMLRVKVLTRSCQPTVTLRPQSFLCAQPVAIPQTSSSTSSSSSSSTTTVCDPVDQKGLEEYTISGPFQVSHKVQPQCTSLTIGTATSVLRILSVLQPFSPGRVEPGPNELPTFSHLPFFIIYCSE